MCPPMRLEKYQRQFVRTVEKLSQGLTYYFTDLEIDDLKLMFVKIFNLYLAHSFFIDYVRKKVPAKYVWGGRGSHRIMFTSECL